MADLDPFYLERGHPVAILASWEYPHPEPGAVIRHQPSRRCGPRNVAIERADGSRVVRSFRGLRKVKEISDE